jgi:hypothetical protein
MTVPDPTKQPAEAVSLASWLAGHCQAMGGGDRVPAPSIEDTDSWMLGYDVGTQDRKGEDSTPPNYTAS